ncbi:MAG: electron transfer flavoprotein subunit beta/FixA family protein, partial [Chitinophagaceae bacterium]|nr:electron transfer flavoprotein subunit beta/FixA family protein [Anaerolineae bacterium]
FTRSTPDTAAKVDVGGNGNVTWGDAATVVNPWDEYALEEAILQAKNSGGKATVIAVGAEMHNEALKHSLAMGLDEAIRLEDPALESTDGLAYATAAAAAINKLGDVDLVIFGKESVDVGTDQHTVMTARKLGWTMLSYVSKILEIDPAAKTIKVEKMLEEGKQIVTSKLPAVISVMKDINEPRYPSFIGIRKASKATIPVWSLADLGAQLPPKKAQLVGFKALPVRDVKVELIEGDPEQQAKILVDRLLEEKVL